MYWCVGAEVRNSVPAFHMNFNVDRSLRFDRPYCIVPLERTRSFNAMSIKKIITHPGIFHADDVCAIAWLRIIGISAPVERRVPSPEELADPDIMVVDVGGQHTSKLNNFDHHQKGGAGIRWDSEVPYAAFGLVVDAFPLCNPAVEQRVHDCVVLPVDAADNGWGTLEGSRPNLSFSACVSGFNPGPSASAAERDTAFETAVAFATMVLENSIRNAEEFVAAKEVVMSASVCGGYTPYPTEGAVFGEKAEPHSILLLEKFVPWSEHVFSRRDESNLLYVVFPSERGGWMVQQVPKAPGSFEGRKPLPEAWSGLRGEDFANVAGIKTHGSATFCHPGRFVCGAETREDAIALARKAVAA